LTKGPKPFILLGKGEIMGNVHELHKYIGDELEKNFQIGKCNVHRDPACDGNELITLFITEKKSRKNGLCKVDALITKDDKVKVIIEIEESGFSPTKICGKYLTSALAKSYIDAKGSEKVLNSKSVLFIEVIDISKLLKDIMKKENSLKKEQLDLLKEEITEMNKRIGYGCIKEYKLVYFDDDKEKCMNDLIAIIKTFIKDN
jgi:hypothetical protein